MATHSELRGWPAATTPIPLRALFSVRRPDRYCAVWSKDTRDAILFFTGLALFIHDALFTMTDRPEFLIVYSAMMGIPAYFFSIRNGKDKGKDE